MLNQWPRYRPNVEREDEIIWLLNKDGKFVVKSVRVGSDTLKMPYG